MYDLTPKNQEEVQEEDPDVQEEVKASDHLVDEQQTAHHAKEEQQVQAVLPYRVSRESSQLNTLCLQVIILQGKSSNLGGAHRLHKHGCMSVESQ